MKHKCSAWVFPHQIVPGDQALECDKAMGKRHGIWHTAQTPDGWFRWARGQVNGVFFQTTGPWGND